jgi:2-dehydropantoate 2-reductase
MLQDIEAGRRTEIDSINGAIVGAARAKGVQTPVISTLATLVKMIEQPIEDPAE